MAYETILYDVDGPVATITLNRPEQLNTIVPPMPDEIEAAVHEAVRDTNVKVIVLRGAGRSFCGGFNFGAGFHLRMQSQIDYGNGAPLPLCEVCLPETISKGV